MVKNVKGAIKKCWPRVVVIREEKSVLPMRKKTPRSVHG